MDDKQGVDLTASTVDIDRYVILNGKHVYVTLTLLYSSCIRVVSSSRAGMGKTLFITRMSERLQTKVTGYNVLIQIPIHGPQVTTDSVMELLVKHQDTSHSTILHFDISPSVCINEAYTATIIVFSISLRCCGRWILSCFHYLFKEASVIARVVCGGTIPHSFMLLKSLYLR